ncbi:trypsin-like cysteine/serine peptidase domain-containing protein [Neurospora crassa]|nr:trypsin-like cysteine/serine peptidase domain-containing protein [Neurospora crassa]
MSKARLDTNTQGYDHRAMAMLITWDDLVLEVEDILVLFILDPRTTGAAHHISWDNLVSYLLYFKMKKACSCIDQAEALTRGIKRCTKELLQSITTIAEQPTPKKKPKQCRLPRSYRPRIRTANTNTSGNSDSISPTTKQTFNHSNSTSPLSPIPPTPRQPPSAFTSAQSHPSHIRKLTLRTRGLIPLPSSLSSITSDHTRLSPTSHALLLKKASSLSQYAPLVLPRSFRRHKAHTVDATLAFAQSEAGTAFCIREDGLLLTAAHCVVETVQTVGRLFWLVMAAPVEEENYSGSTLRGGGCKRGGSNIPPKSRSRIVGARCIAWDLGRDLALLKITHAQALDEGLAIGHAADEHPDDPPGVKAYGSEHRRVLQLSSGRYLGIAPDKVGNPQDNSDTGAMQHDCWTYWGHSGGPIFEQNAGVLVGVHVDWNPEEPLVKRAVPWVAVEAFLEENGFWS